MWKKNNSIYSSKKDATNHGWFVAPFLLSKDVSFYSLSWSAVSVIGEFFKNDETEVKKCTLTENHMGQGFGNYGSARGSRRSNLRKKWMWQELTSWKSKAAKGPALLSLQWNWQAVLVFQLDYLLLGTECNDKKRLLQSVIAFLSELEANLWNLTKRVRNLPSCLCCGEIVRGTITPEPTVTA